MDRQAAADSALRRRLPGRTAGDPGFGAGGFRKEQLPQPVDVSRKYIKTLLIFSGAAEAPSTTPPAGFKEQEMVETLSGREMDVLRCMSAGMKYQEIADTLYISLNTVRFHVKSIYGKMAVDNRTKAIEKARHLGLL